MYDWDLYKLVPNAKIVFLSACESGIGNFEVGAGVNSISKHFLTNKINIVVKTLWLIEDEQAYNFSEMFYNNLQKNNTTIPKNISSIKRRLLKNKHPKHWASTILNGNKSILINFN